MWVQGWTPDLCMCCKMYSSCSTMQTPKRCMGAQVREACQRVRCALGSHCSSSSSGGTGRGPRTRAEAARVRADGLRDDLHRHLAHDRAVRVAQHRHKGPQRLVLRASGATASYTQGVPDRAASPPGRLTQCLVPAHAASDAATAASASRDGARRTRCYVPCTQAACYVLCAPRQHACKGEQQRQAPQACREAPAASGVHLVRVLPMAT